MRPVWIRKEPTELAYRQADSDPRNFSQLPIHLLRLVPPLDRVILGLVGHEDFWQVCPEVSFQGASHEASSVWIRAGACGRSH